MTQKNPTEVEFLIFINVDRRNQIDDSYFNRLEFKHIVKNIFSSAVKTTGESNLIFKLLVPSLVVGLDIVRKIYQVFSKTSEIFLVRLQEEIAY